MPATVDLPQRPIEQYWRDCRLSQVSPHARCIAGACTFTSPDTSQIVVRGLWSTDNGKMVADVPAGVINVDDKGRALIQDEAGVVSLWVNGTTTPLTSLVRLTKKQSLLHPRFDATNQLVAILSTTQGKQTTWQAVRFTASRTTSSH